MNTTQDNKYDLLELQREMKSFSNLVEQKQKNCDKVFSIEHVNILLEDIAIEREKRETDVSLEDLDKLENFYLNLRQEMTPEIKK